MNALLICLFAASFASLSNYFFRKSSLSQENKDNTTGYLLVYYLLSLTFSLILYPKVWNSPINFLLLALGGCVGIFNVILMQLTSRAFQKGPVGLTLAFQNGSSVFPGMLLFLFFGDNFGFSCTNYQLSGIALVLLGLYLGSRQKSGASAITTEWLKFAILAFTAQVAALTIIQGRCILFDLDKNMASEAADGWFLIGQFTISCIVQVSLFLKEGRSLQFKEIAYGSFGGIANFGAAFFLLLATKQALPLEKTLIFPVFAVAVIIICNLWAKKIYQEAFNIPANSTCALGILIGSL